MGGPRTPTCPHPVPDRPTQAPPSPHHGPAPSSGSSYGSHIQAPHMSLDKAFCQPHTFHSPSFLTLRMTPLRISAGKVGYWILWPQCAPKPSGPWGWASIFTPVYFSHQSCEVTPSVTPNLQTGKQVQRGQVTSLSTLSPKWLNAWGLSSHSIYALDERITEKPELTYRSTSLQSLALSLAICNLEFSWWER